MLHRPTLAQLIAGGLLGAATLAFAATPTTVPVEPPVPVLTSTVATGGATHPVSHPRRCLKRSRLGKCERWASRTVQPATPPVSPPVVTPAR